LTGKVVATFNGRVAPSDGRESFESGELLEVAQRPWGIHDFFFAHMAHVWRRTVTRDYTQLNGNTPGHLIYDGDQLRCLFCNTPNPTLGKFAVDDLRLLNNPARGMRVWDHEWVDHLSAQRRLIVQTNLELGMSIEADKAVAGLPGRTAAPAINAGERQREMFATRLSEYCFTTTRLADAR
jgi:hypothetical protein